ncbi:MAG: hypothetical protein HRU15_01865 [Planctomycetes bacterium]|nr:hypothetical protein [Planctomycetota bacterium]
MSVLIGVSKDSLMSCIDVGETRIHDDLMVSVIYSKADTDSGSDSGESLLVALDMVACGPGFKQFQTIVSAATNITEDKMSFCSSHTHSDMTATWDWEKVAQKIAEHALLAREKAVPARVAYGQQDVGRSYSVNRRFTISEEVGAISVMMPRGTQVDVAEGTEDITDMLRDFYRYGCNIQHPKWFCHGADPADGPETAQASMQLEIDALRDGENILEGPIDADLDVLCFYTMDNELIVTVHRFSCHPVIYTQGYGLDDDPISGDFPYVVSREIEKATGAPAVFMQGASGNIKPMVDVNKSMDDELERVGCGLAQHALNLMEHFVPEDLRCFAFTRTVEEYAIAPDLSQYDEDDSIATAAAYAEQQKQGFEFLELRKALDHNLRVWIASVWLQHIQSAEIGINHLRINDLHMVTIPGELLCEHAIALKSQFPEQQVMVVTKTDSCRAGYIATREHFKLGGYEVATAPFAAGFGESLMDRCAQLISGAHSSLAVAEEHV